MKKQRARSDSEKQYRKEKLQQSAKKLFSFHGYRGTTIGMITDDAGLSPASFYLYFASKLEMYRTLNNMGIDILESMVTSALKEAPGGSGAKIRAIAGAYFRFFMEEREYYHITAILHLGQREFFADLSMVPELEERTKTLLSVMASIINEGMKSGELVQVDPWKTAVTLWGMMDGVLILEVKQSTGFTGVKIDALVEQMTHLMLRGISEK